MECNQLVVMTTLLLITFNDLPFVSIGSNNANTVSMTQLDTYNNTVTILLT